ncbi:MAG: NAD(P)H-dependent oxidoreductase [Gammaproteobacteria bacterium]|nr:NAD(P)H-dependent oxidoreductase [Gammaproteobacteria bacterium]
MNGGDDFGKRAAFHGVNPKRLLIVYHSQRGSTGRMAQAVFDGARDPEIENVETRLVRAADAQPEDLLWAQGLIIGTPENFGYMSGGMKDFFDRTFYPVEGKIQPLPYAIFISAENDGTGALRAIRRIAPGYPFNEVQDPVIAKGELTESHLAQCRELGMALAAGLDAGIF